MPRTPHKDPLDFSEAAHAVMDQVIAKAAPVAVEIDANAADDSLRVAAGRKGAKALSATRRTAIAQQAAEARWVSADR